MYNKTLQNLYLDWFNNYLSFECFAEHNGMTKAEAMAAVRLGEEIHERLVQEHKELAEYVQSVRA